MSVIDISVNSDQFKAFAKQFADYQAQLKALPGAWKEQEASVDSISSGLRDMTAAMMAQAAALHEQGAERTRQQRADEKDRRDKEKVQIKEKKDTAERLKASKQLVSDAKSIAGSVASTTFNLVKWATMGGALGLVAGGFGVGEAISAIGNAGRNASRLGITPGESASADVALSRYGNVPGWLQMESTSQLDISKLAGYRIAGINPNGKDPAALLYEDIAKSTALFKQILAQSGGNMALAGARADAMRLTERFSVNDLRAFAGDPNLQAQLNAAKNGTGPFNLKPGDVASAQDFQGKITALGYKLSSVFAPSLTKLEKPLTDLVEAFGKMAATFAGNPQFQASLDKFAKTISQYEFDPVKFNSMINNVIQFGSDIGVLHSKMADFFATMGWGPDDKGNLGAPGTRGLPQSKWDKHDKSVDANRAMVGSIWHHLGGAISPFMTNGSGRNNPWAIRDPGQSTGFRDFGSLAEGAATVARQLQRYQYSGAFGHADTLSKLISTYEGARTGNKDNNNIAAYIKDVVSRMHIGADTHVDTKDVGFISNLLAAIAVHEGRSKTHPTAQQISIWLKAEPGANVQTSTAQIAHR